MIEILLVLNAIWFALGFHTFYIRRIIFAKILVAKEHRETPVFAILAESGKFLGGFNIAFAVLNILLLFNLELFNSDAQWALLLLVNAVAHGSQFYANLPIAIQNRRGEGVWQVLKGLILFIFVVDFLLMAANFSLSAMLWSS